VTGSSRTFRGGLFSASLHSTPLRRPEIADRMSTIAERQFPARETVDFFGFSKDRIGAKPEAADL